MKKNFYFVALISLAITSLTSCNQDAPEINFSNSTTNSTDYQGIIDAINNINLSLNQKLSAIESAINSQTLAFEEKMNLLKAAQEAGILKMEEKLNLMIIAVNAIGDNLDGIKEAIKLVDGSISGLSTELSEKLNDINTSIENGTISNSEAIDKLIKIMEQAEVEKGIQGYSDDEKSFFITPGAMNILNKSPELKQEYIDKLQETVPEVTTSQVSEHSCIIAINRKSYQGFEFVTETDKTTYPVTTLKVSKITNSATYTIDKGGCALGCYEINITDVRGNGITRYDFNGSHGGDVEIVFTDGNGKYVLTGHIEVIMR